MESELNFLLDYPNYTASLMEEHEYVMMCAMQKYYKHSVKSARSVDSRKGGNTSDKINEDNI